MHGQMIAFACIALKFRFYHHTIMNFIYPFVLEQINSELLTENKIINHKINNISKPKSQIQASVGPVLLKLLK